METTESHNLSVYKGKELPAQTQRRQSRRDELDHKIIDASGNDLAAKTGRVIQEGGFESQTSYKQVKAIMGDNFFGVEEAIKHFGVNPSKQELACLAEVPFAEEQLSSCRDTHVLVAVFPMSVSDIRCKVKSELFSRHTGELCVQMDFAMCRGEVGWHLLLKGPVADSTYKNWNEQQALLTKDEEMPAARIIIYTAIGRFLQTGKRLFECVNVRSSTIGLCGNHVHVGFGPVNGLHFGIWFDDCRVGHLGASAARKPRSLVP